MQRALMIKAESNDWCGISDVFVFMTELENEDMALDAALEEFEDVMKDHLYTEYYNSEEDDEDFITQEEALFTFSTEWYAPEIYGELDSVAYQKLN